MSLFPWVVPHEGQGIDLDEFPGVKRWFERIHARPAVQRGLAVMADARSAPDDDAKAILFDKKF